MFLAVKWNTVIDRRAEKAVPARLDDGGGEVTPSIPAVAEVSHVELSNVYTEASAESVARNLNNGLEIDYFEIDVLDNRKAVSLHKVRLKQGPREQATVREVVVIETDTGDVGSIEVTV